MIVSQPMQKKGFTLIELLVVISIISLLSSVVLTSLQAARERAEITAMVASALQVRNAIQISLLEDESLVSTSRLSANNNNSAWSSTLADLESGGFIAEIPDFSKLKLVSSTYPRTRPTPWVDGDTSTPGYQIGDPTSTDYYCEGGVTQPDYFVYFYVLSAAANDYVGHFPRVLRASNDAPLSRRFCLFLPVS